MKSKHFVNTGMGTGFEKKTNKLCCDKVDFTSSPPYLQCFQQQSIKSKENSEGV